MEFKLEKLIIWQKLMKFGEQINSSGFTSDFDLPTKAKYH